MNDSVHELLAKWQKRALLVGAFGAGMCVIGLLFRGADVLESYLFAFVFWSGLALGCLAWAMLHRLTGGQWGTNSRRLFEAAALGIVPLTVLFLPILLGLSHLYPWARPAEVAADPSLRHKAVYLNTGFFLVRAGICFAIWIALATFVSRWSAREDDGTAPKRDGGLRRWCAIGLALYVLTVSFASVDWVMSLEPHWFSMIYGLLYVVGQGLGAIAFIIVLLVALGRYRPPEESVGSGHYHDLGTLMFAFVMLFAYIAFCQFLIIWYGNLHEEIPWYARRISAGWQLLAILIIAAHFFIPFALLLNRSIKRNARLLSYVAGGLLVMRFLDQFWTVMPAFRPEGPLLNWLDIATTLAIGGLFLAFVAWRLSRTPLVVAGALAGEAPAHE